MEQSLPEIGCVIGAIGSLTHTVFEIIKEYKFQAISTQPRYYYGKTY